MNQKDIQHLLIELESLEKSSALLDPPQNTRESLKNAVDNFAEGFLQNLSKEKAYYINTNSDSPLAIEKTGVSITETLNCYQSLAMESGINAASQGHMGYIPGGGLYPSALGDYIAAITNRYAGIFYAAPGAVKIENLLIRWISDLMGFPKSSTGNLTSGGSISNLIAIVAARDAKEIKARNYHQAVFYLTEQTHHSLQKAIRIAGMAESIIRYIPIDEAYRMNTKALQAQIKKDFEAGLNPFFVNASLGTTNTGAVDNIQNIGTIAKAQQLWFHIDAAYGGFFKLVDDCAPYFEGVEQADSMTLDPHKSLFLPFGTGAVLIKDTKAVLKSHYYLADYMQDSYADTNEISPADVSPELTKHFRGLRMWLPLKLFGTKPFEAALKEKILLAQYFYKKINTFPHFETGPFPELSIAMFRYIPPSGNPNQFNQQLLEYIQKDGRIFLSSTTIENVFWIRVAVLVFRTHRAQIDLLLEIIESGVKYISAAKE